MEYVNQPQGTPVTGGQQDQGQATAAAQATGQPQAQQPGQPQADQMAAGYQAIQPQPGGFYQYQPGVGFVQVQSVPIQPGMGTQATMDAQAAAASAQAAMGTQATGAAAMGQTTLGAQAVTGEATNTTTQTGMFGQGMPDGTQPQFDQNKLGEVYGMVNDVMNGDAEPTQLLSLLSNTGSDFWKGALVGAVATVLLNNDAVKGAVAGVFDSVFGDADPEGEQVTVGGK